MKIYRRREFLSVVGGAAAAAIAVACGDDSDDGGSETASSSPTRAPSAAASPTVTAGTDAAAVAIRWFGQSMFLVTSPGGTKLLLDPFGPIGYPVPPPIETSAATISHEHGDHNNASLSTGTILKGLTADGWATIDQRFGDVRVFSVQSFHDAAQGAQRGRNAIFVYETGGLRLAHLGDLGHALSPQQVTALGGPVDVLMVPVGGGFTIGAPEATALVSQLNPKVVFPMHYKTPAININIGTVDAFLEGKSVQRVGTNTTRFARSELPAQTQVRVLEYT
jgi:L-ascorbate metabolism protein UlaG (beta-lactamase superfamily)